MIVAAPREVRRDPAAGVDAAAPRAKAETAEIRPGVGFESLGLRVQTAVGNHAAGRLFRVASGAARQQTQRTARAATELAELNEDITQAIAQKETRRRPIESGMQTSAGPRASFASEVQATTLWTIDALRSLPPGRRALFGLGDAELRSARRRAVAAGEVWDAVMRSPPATTPVVFARANSHRAVAAGLIQADIDRMFLFRDLRSDLEHRLAAVPAREAQIVAMAPGAAWSLATPAERRLVGAPRAPAMTPARRDRLAPVVARREAIAAVAAGVPATTLGISVGTINAYRPVGGGQNYAEDKAAWQRVAVGREPPGGAGTVGTRVETAATADGGLRLARLVIARINEAFLQAKPDASDDELCDNAARRHNPGNPMMDDVRRYFHHFRALRSAGDSVLPRAWDAAHVEAESAATPPAAPLREAQIDRPRERSDEDVLAMFGLDDPGPTASPANA